MYPQNAHVQADLRHLCHSQLTAHVQSVSGVIDVTEVSIQNGNLELETVLGNYFM